jgi:type IV pilus assembly protein PilE
MIKMNNTKQKQFTAGFSFVELVIVLLIFAIILTVAVPAYTSYVMQARRTDARTSLTLDQTIIERCYAQNFSYSATCTAMPTYSHTSQQGFYSISISNLTATTYTLTATATGQQVKDTLCASFSVNQTNQKTALDNAGAAQATCWSM